MVRIMEAKVYAIKLGALIGCLASTLDNNAYKIEHVREEVAGIVSELICEIIRFCDLLHVSIVKLVEAKMNVNRMKYPAKMTNIGDGIPKYTTYSRITKIFRDSDVKIVHGCRLDETAGDQHMELWRSYDMLMENVRCFAVERGWIDKYSVLEILVSLFTELGELVEILNWKSNDQNIEESWEAVGRLRKLMAKTLGFRFLVPSPRDGDLMDLLGREIADICIYILHFCRMLGFKDHQILVGTTRNK